jgi:agmatinase
MTTFNPNELGMANGNYFALPYSMEESEIALIPVPWDVTTSYRPGTSDGPSAIMDASLQVDLYDANVPDAWKIKIGTAEFYKSLGKKNKTLRKTAEKIIEHLEKGGDPLEIQDQLKKINLAGEELNQLVFKSSLREIEMGRVPGIVGGDHSVPLGQMRAIGEKYDDFGILHIDAHADLRIAYEGFKYSHASILYNALNEVTQISQLTQVGIRDFCEQEAEIIDTDPRIRCFTDMELKKNIFEGKTWKKQCEEIVSSLPSNVYISFDIDGLSPDLCPNTGTPVPGGLSFREIDYLLHMLAVSGKRIVGFDLCEVAPHDENEWDANVGARILYKLCIYTHLNNKRLSTLP